MAKAITTEDRGANLQVSCWCEKKIVTVPVDAVLAGQTGSCGRPSCKSPADPPASPAIPATRGFVVWSRKNLRPRPPGAAIRRVGPTSYQLDLNRWAVDLLGDPQALVFAFDVKQRIIGLRATEREDPDGWPTRTGQSGGLTVAATAFCRRYRIRPGPMRPGEVVDDCIFAVPAEVKP